MFFKRFLCKIGFVFLLHFSSHASTCSHENLLSEPTIKRQLGFKLGLELQESSNLVTGHPSEEPKPIYEYDTLFSKKPIFIISSINSAKKLFKIEIDGQDIEFITYPFSENELSDINSALDGIEYTCNILKSSFKNVADHYLTFIDTRLENAKKFRALNRKMHAGDPISEEEDQLYNVYSNNLDQAFTRSFPTFELLKTELEKNPIFNVRTSEIYNKLQNKQIFIKSARLPALSDVKEPKYKIERNEAEETFISSYQHWIPRFQPQLTVQLPLKNLIAFLFDLFSEDVSVIRDFLKYLPHVENIENYQDFFKNISSKPATINIHDYPVYQTSEMGLMFLHASTLFNLIPEKAEKKSLKFFKFKENFENTAQVDAKSQLRILSRRPFNEMRQEIKQGNDEYSLNKLNNKYFQERFTYENFLNIDYAQEFFLDGKRQDLSHMLSFIDLQGASSDDAEELLKNGLLTLSMITNLKNQELKNFWKEYHTNACNLDKEDFARYNITITNDSFSIQTTSVKHDALSPPYFHDDTLETGDAMGHFRKDLRNEYDLEGSNVNEGDAIIEIRDISSFKIKDENFFGDFKYFLENHLFRALHKKNID